MIRLDTGVRAEPYAYARNQIMAESRNDKAHKDTQVETPKIKTVVVSTAECCAKVQNLRGVPQI